MTAQRRGISVSRAAVAPRKPAREAMAFGRIMTFGRIMALAAATAAALALFQVPAPATESADEVDADTVVVEELPGTEAAPPSEAESRKLESERELEALTKNIRLTRERQAELAREIDAIDRDRDTLNADLLRTAQRIHTLEAELDATEERLVRLKGNVAGVRGSLNERRGVLAEVLAALQRIGRRPPPALAVRPEDALTAVRSAMLLNAVMPEIRVEAEALAADLAQLTGLRDEIASERDRLQSDAQRLAEERSRVELLIAAKREEREKSNLMLAREKEKSRELAEEATSLKGLIASLEEEIAAAREAAQKAAEADTKRLGRRQPDDPFADPGRIAPAIAFASAKGLLALPVRGAVLRGYGSDDGFGAQTEGISIAARNGASVTAPADAWVVYAGPFRSYGQLLILNAGDGYHVLLAGMERIDVDLGQFVLAGEPVAVMGTPRVASAAALNLGVTRPVLYVEFRKNGNSVDPTPWWAGPEDEKVGG